MTILLNEDAAPRRRVIRLRQVPHTAPAPAPAVDPLLERAALLWPDGEPYAERNRAEWLRAVGVVRKTARGWLVDRRVDRLERPL